MLFSSGCMESLVFYKRLIMRVHNDKLDEGQRNTLNAECSRLLATLQVIDPKRKHRYEDLGKEFPYRSGSDEMMRPGPA